jgi:hypothetical protein
LNRYILEHRPQGALSKDIVRFDSQLELGVYLILLEFYPTDRIELQHRIEIKPKTKWSGAMHYVADFRIDCIDPFLVEAKGKMTSESLVKLKILESLYPELREGLMIVSERENFYFGNSYPPSVSVKDFRLNLAVINYKPTHHI